MTLGGPTIVLMRNEVMVRIHGHDDFATIVTLDREFVPHALTGRKLLMLDGEFRGIGREMTVVGLDDMAFRAFELSWRLERGGPALIL